MKDNRHIETGRPIPGENYCDQPYIVHTKDGAWLCVMTTGTGDEGNRGQHVVSMRSFDHGATWIDRCDLEPADGPEASYAVLAMLPSGRVLCFYNYNADNIRSVLSEDGQSVVERVDSLGHFVFRYSDNHGVSWSEERYDVPIRYTDVDINNVYSGDIRFFWNVGKPFMLGTSLYVPITKIGSFNESFMNNTEGFLVCCLNPTAYMPTDFMWRTLPKGDVGLTAPLGGGSISEEHSYGVLRDGSIFCVARSVNGHPTQYYSRDGGETFSEPTFMTYDGKIPVKNPRAANFVWRCGNGRWLYWFHNNSTKGYENRNPVFICGGIEVVRNGMSELRWSQPELLLYDDDPGTRISYPDLIEDEGKYYFSETQKTVARIHEFDGSLFNGMWASLEEHPALVAQEGLVLRSRNNRTSVFSLDAPHLSPVSSVSESGKGRVMTRGGFTIELWVLFQNTTTGQVLASTMSEEGKGWELRAGLNGRLEFVMSDGKFTSVLVCREGLLRQERPNHIAITVDEAPCIMSFMINGVVSDGGERAFGFSFFSNAMGDVSGSDTLTLGTEGACNVRIVRIYNRPLRNFELISNYRCGF